MLQGRSHKGPPVAVLSTTTSSWPTACLPFIPSKSGGSAHRPRWPHLNWVTPRLLCIRAGSRCKPDDGDGTMESCSIGY